MEYEFGEIESVHWSSSLRYLPNLGSREDGESGLVVKAKSTMKDQSVVPGPLYEAVIQRML